MSTKILLIYVQNVYISNTDPKHVFRIKTSSVEYKIMCKSVLDTKLWIGTIEKCVKICRENEEILDLDRRIYEIQSINHENIKKNSVIDREKLLKTNAAVEKTFQMLQKYKASLFPKFQNPGEFLPALKAIFLQIPKGNDHTTVDINLQKSMFAD
jgi:hypothetical protein